MERLAASAWTDTEEVGVVGHLDLALLAGDVDTYRKPLTVGIVCGQRRVFRAFEMFLEEEAQGGIRESEKQVIVRIERIGVAGERINEEFQLIVGSP